MLGSAGYEESNLREAVGCEGGEEEKGGEKGAGRGEGRNDDGESGEGRDFWEVERGGDEENGEEKDG